MMVRLAVLSLLVCSSAASAQRAGALEGKKIAVLEFSDSSQLVQGLLETLSDQARGAVVDVTRAEGALVLTRENMLEVLKATGGRCVEGECEVETARNLQVEYFLTGSFAGRPGALLLTLKVFDTRKGALLGQKLLKAESDMALLELVRPATSELVREALGLGRPRPSAVRTQPGLQAGSFEEAGKAVVAGAEDEVVVKFESDPVGASVRLDGELLCKETPCSKRVLAGRHEVAFEQERYSAAKVTAVAVKGAVVRGLLQPNFGWLNIETDVPGVSVSVDGVDAGKTPLSAREAGPGMVEVAVSDRCFTRTGERVLVGTRERRTVRLSARPRLAGLKVNAVDGRGNDLEARVWVDGRDLGDAGTVLKVPVCSQQASVVVGGGEWTTSLRLEEGQVTVLEAMVEAARGDSDGDVSDGSGTGPRGGATADVVGIGTIATKGAGTATQGEGKEVELQARTTLETAEVESATVDREGLARYVKKRLRAITSCYEKELRRNPSLKGRVVVRFTIKPDGRTTDVKVDENTVGSDPVAQCIRTLIRAWTFPFKPEEEATVSYPFAFAPAN